MVDPEISDTRIFRATYLLLLKEMSNDNLAELPDDLVLAIVEDVAESNWMITTWAVILHPLTG